MRKPAKRTKARASLKRGARKRAGVTSSRAKRAVAKRAGAKSSRAKRNPAKSKVKRPTQARKSSKPTAAAGRKLKRVAKEAARAGLVAAGLTGVRAALEEFGPSKKEQAEEGSTQAAPPSEEKQEGGNEDETS